MSGWPSLEPYWHILAAAGTMLGPVLTVLTLCWVLATKKDAISAVAWCLVVFFLPLLGPLLFVLFGYQHIHRPLSRKRRHKRLFQATHSALPALVPAAAKADERGPEEDWEREPFPSAVTASAAAPPAAPRPLLPHRPTLTSDSEDLARLAERFGAFPLTYGNQLTVYHEGPPAFAAMLDAIRAARHHVHLESFIFQPDATGQAFLELLTHKAREGVQVRLLYDAMGSYRLHRRLLRPLRAAGGQCSVFLSLNPFRRRIQVNMRDHRKILVVDGQVAFTGGLNIGDEYQGRVPRFGYWRDTHLRLEGPAVMGLQRIFSEDWDFAAGEGLHGETFFPPPCTDGPWPVQVIESGPDRELKGIREVYFAAILRARERLWIATPYFVPDAALLDALRLAAYLGVDVRLLGQYHPDKWIPYFASRYYWADMLNVGVKVYQYTKGMMHSKVVLVDGQWASVGTANLDYRSLHLNFEVNCLLPAPKLVAELEEAFCRDLHTAVQLQRESFSRRALAGRLLENACRLMSPVL